MTRTSLSILLALASASIWAQSASTAGAAPPAAAAIAIVNEPMVVWDTTGSAFAGTLHRNLVVYNSGLVMVSKRDDNPFGNLDIDVQTAEIGPDAALKLLLDLVVAGAASLPDQDIGAADIPLKTLTLLEGKELALSRTYSYWDGFGAYGGPDQILNQFVADTFPTF